MKKLLPLAAFVATMAAPADAAIVNLNVKLTGGTFESWQGDRIDLSGPLADFDVSFDNSENVATTDAGLVINASSLSLDKAFKFSYNHESQTLNFGSSVTDDGYKYNKFGKSFGVTLYPFVKNPFVEQAAYTNGTGKVYWADWRQGNISAVITDITSSAAPAVPEPATWLMMTLGFGILAYAMRRRPRVPVAASM